MFTIFTLFSTLTKIHWVCVKGHQNNFQTPRIIPRRKRPPPILKLLDPPLYSIVFKEKQTPSVVWLLTKVILKVHRGIDEA